VVRGQFRGYRDEEGVAPDSEVETYAAVECFIDSWRWADVPFAIRAGKCLHRTATEVLVKLRCPPQRVFSGRDVGPIPANYFRFRLGPDLAIALGAQVLGRGEGESVSRELLACAETGSLRSPYDRLLTDAIEGDPLLFARQDEVDAAWAIVDPVLQSRSPLHEYEPGSWGPKEADPLVDPLGGWHDPA
jgi:glucose-6-phosphate 1-dehydrogenase